MRRNGREIGVEKKPKYAKMVIGRRNSKDNFKWGLKINGGRRKDVERVSNYKERFSPRIRWKRCLDKMGVNDVVESSYGAFNFPIFFGGCTNKKNELLCHDLERNPIGVCC